MNKPYTLIDGIKEETIIRVRLDVPNSVECREQFNPVIYLDLIEPLPESRQSKLISNIRLSYLQGEVLAFYFGLRARDAQRNLFFHKRKVIDIGDLVSVISGKPYFGNVNGLPFSLTSHGIYDVLFRCQYGIKDVASNAEACWRGIEPCFELKVIDHNIVKE